MGDILVKEGHLFSIVCISIERWHPVQYFILRTKLGSHDLIRLHFNTI